MKHRPKCSGVALETQLAPAELCAMRSDGEVWPLGPGHIIIDAPVDLRARSAVLLNGTPPGFVLMGLSAAWAWGCLAVAPAKIEVARADGLRFGTTLSAHFRVRDVSWSEGDIVTMREGYVTSIPRTIIDIARYETSTSQSDIHSVLVELERVSPGSLRRANDRLIEAPHLPYKSRALSRLATAPLATLR